MTGKSKGVRPGHDKSVTVKQKAIKIFFEQKSLYIARQGQINKCY